MTKVTLYKVQFNKSSKTISRYANNKQEAVDMKIRILRNKQKFLGYFPVEMVEVK